MEKDAAPTEPVVYSFIYICQSPQLRSPPMKTGKTYGHHPCRRRPTYNDVQPGSPRGSFSNVDNVLWNWLCL